MLSLGSKLKLVHCDCGAVLLLLPKIDKVLLVLQVYLTEIGALNNLSLVVEVERGVLRSDHL